MQSFKNPVANHLSKIMTNNACESPICNCFLDEQLFRAHMEGFSI